MVLVPSPIGGAAHSLPGAVVREGLSTESPEAGFWAQPSRVTIPCPSVSLSAN